MPSRKGRPLAVIVLRRRGRYTDHDAVHVQALKMTNSYEPSLAALRRAGIEPIVSDDSDVMRMRFDPGEIAAEDAVLVVKDALRRGGVRVASLG